MFESRKEIENGRLVALALSGSWRDSSPSPRLSSAELAKITPLLIQAGAGALVWRRIRDGALANTDAGGELQQTYRLHRLEAIVHLQQIERIVARLRAAGIEPVLVKGWSVARLYAEPGLRHYIDVDLCVAAGDYPKAQQLLATMGADGLYVDLHNELDHLDTIAWDQFFARTQLLRVADREADAAEIRVPCAEDHLRLVCIHWLRHGAWKPAGLCDIAAMLESLPRGFDWQCCLGPDPIRAGWVVCTIRLAQQLFGAEIRGQGSEDRDQMADGRSQIVEGSGQRFDVDQGAAVASMSVPPAVAGGPLASSQLPRWLVPAVLRQWQSSFSPNHRQPALLALVGNVTSWQGLVSEISARLDQPVRATVALHGRFNNWPRLPYQLGELLLHGAEVPKQLASMLRRPALKREFVASNPAGAVPEVPGRLVRSYVAGGAVQ